MKRAGALLILTFAVASAHADIGGMPSPAVLRALTATSAAVVIGTVQDVSSVETLERDLVTLVRLRVEEVLKGDVSAASVTLKEDGGQIASRRKVVFDAPAFAVGERALVFLGVRPDDGSLRTNGLALGKIGMEPDIADAGAPARRQLGLMARGVPGLQTRDHRLASLLNLVRTVVAESPVASPMAFRVEPAEASDPSLLRQVVAPGGVAIKGARFFEADEGIPIPFLLDSTYDSYLGLEEARQTWGAAMAAWSNVSTATIELRDAGTTTERRSPFTVGFDPNSSFTGCLTDVVGYGGFVAMTDEVKVFNGVTFDRIVSASARILSDQGAHGCPVWTRCNVGEALTHELGHAIGLDHASSPEASDATMASSGHGDCRCAGVRSPDFDAVSFVYPTALPPTITTPSRLPDATVDVPYLVLLTVVGGAGGFTWAFAEDGSNPGLDDFGPLVQLSADGVISGTPRYGIDTSAHIKATDAAGNSHTKRFDLSSYVVGSPTTTSTTVTTSTAPTIDPKTIPCETTTSTTLPSFCDTADGFPGIECKVREGLDLAAALGRHKAAVRRQLRRLDRDEGRARGLTVLTRPSLEKRLKRATACLQRAEGHARRLTRLAARRRFIAEVGSANAGALRGLAETLLSRLGSTREGLRHGESVCVGPGRSNQCF